MSATFPPRLDPAERVSDAELSGALAALQAAVLAGVAEASVKSGELKAFRVGSIPAGWTQVSGPTLAMSSYIPNTLLPVLPAGVSAPNIRFATAGGVLYALGLTSGVYSFQRFDEATGAWVSLAAIGLTGSAGIAMGPLIALPSGRLLHTSVSASAAVATTRIYDPTTGAWSPGANLPVAGRSGGGFLLSDGTAYVSSASAASAYAYNETTNTWAAKAVSPIPSTIYRGANYVSLGDGRVLAANGTSYHIYDEATDTWSAAVNMQNSVSVPFDVPIFRIGGTVYAVPTTSITNDGTLRTYDVALNTWLVSSEAALGSSTGDAGQLSDGSWIWLSAVSAARAVRRSTNAVPTATVWAVKD